MWIIRPFTDLELKRLTGAMGGLKVKLTLLLTALMVSGAVSALEAADLIGQREADKAEGIKRIMVKRKFEMRPVVTKQNKEFCERFVQDFRVQKDECKRMLILSSLTLNQTATTIQCGGLTEAVVPT